MERAGAPDWLAARLAEPAGDCATVVVHSIMWQYLSDLDRARVRSALDATGARATRAAPLAWLRLEPPPRGAREAELAELRLTVWPDGRRAPARTRRVPRHAGPARYAPSVSTAPARLHVTRSRANPGGMDVTKVLGTDTEPFRGRKPPWFKVQAPGGRKYRELSRMIRDEEPAHGLPGGRLPERRRLLGARHGDVHDPRRHVHAALRVLQRQDRQADLERPARAAARRALGGADGAAPRGHHQRRPRRPARLRRRGLGRRDPLDPHAGAVVQGRVPDARLPRRGDAAGQGDRRAPRRLQPQRRGRPAALPRRPPRLALGALAARAAPTPRRWAATRS